MGEVWSETIGELQLENVRPVTPDQEAMEAISRAIEERAVIVAATQQELIEAQKNQDVIDEQEFYAQMRENHRQKEKAIADFTQFVARTSNFQELKAAKEKQEISIDASRMHPINKQGDHFHDVSLPNLTSTVFSGKHVTVIESVKEKNTAPVIKFDPTLNALADRPLKHYTI